MAKGGRKPGEDEFAAKARQETILHGQADMVGVLVDSGADPNRASVDGATPLDDACLKGLKEIAGLLIAHGAKVNARNKAGVIPLHNAALGGNADVVKLLLGHGAEINARDGESGATALY